MKKILLLALFVVLFFACSNDGLDVKTPEKQFCSVVEQGQSKCYSVSKEICDALVGTVVESCTPEISSSSAEVIGGESSSSGEVDGSSSSGEVGDSSSSGEVGDSSSSDGDGDSSSSVVVGSSSSSDSVPTPRANGGSISFRRFDYSSSSSTIYFLGTNNMYVSTSNPGDGKLFNNNLAIENAVDAKCGDITFEVTIGNGSPVTMPTASPGLPVNTPGEITAKAVATCNGKKYELAEATATVVPNPSFSDCNPAPQKYVYRGEAITDLVSLNYNYNRCGNITYSPATYSSSSGDLSRNITASVSCSSSSSVTRSCPVSVFVADRNIGGFVECGKDFTLTNGTTVFEYRCGEDGTQYYIKCSSDDANFKLSADGFTETTSTWGGANLPGYPDPYPTIPKDGFFYFPGRILATVTNAPAGGYSCTSW